MVSKEEREALRASIEEHRRGFHRRADGEANQGIVRLLDALDEAEASASASASAVEVIRGAAHARLAANALAAMTARAEKAEQCAAVYREELERIAKVCTETPDRDPDAGNLERTWRTPWERTVEAVDRALASTAGATLLAELEAARAVVEAARRTWCDDCDDPAACRALALAARCTCCQIGAAIATYDARVKP